jgi:hypothetical protein
MGNAANIWGTTVVGIATVLATYCAAAETGKALIEATGVAAQTVEAKYVGPCADADNGWDSL